MARGNHIRVFRPLIGRDWGYYHHGIDCGDGSAIHFTGEPLKKKGATVERTLLDKFRGKGTVEVRNPKLHLHPVLVMERAMVAVEQTGYNLLINNCEHFATSCTSVRTLSAQVRTASNTMPMAFAHSLAGSFRAGPAGVAIGLIGLGAGAYLAGRREQDCSVWTHLEGSDTSGHDEDEDAEHFRLRLHRRYVQTYEEESHRTLTAPIEVKPKRGLWGTLKDVYRDREDSRKNPRTISQVLDEMYRVTANRAWERACHDLEVPLGRFRRPD